MNPSNFHHSSHCDPVFREDPAVRRAVATRRTVMRHDFPTDKAFIDFVDGLPGHRLDNADLGDAFGKLLELAAHGDVTITTPAGFQVTVGTEWDNYEWSLS